MPTAQMKAKVPVTLKRRMYTTLRRRGARFPHWLRATMEQWLRVHEHEYEEAAQQARVGPSALEGIATPTDVSHRLRSDEYAGMPWNDARRLRRPCGWQH